VRWQPAGEAGPARLSGGRFKENWFLNFQRLLKFGKTLRNSTRIIIRNLDMGFVSKFF
jgi:hypothetical protein